jgi:indolepyruvate ferredoxin oxidoreductase
LVGDAAVGAFDADGATTRLMGDSIYTNPMMMGYAWQKGWIPLEKASLIRAIELNAVAVQQNKIAFEWGCRAAHDWPSVQKLMTPLNVIEFKKRESLAGMLEKRVAFLTAYQDAAYAASYSAFVQKVKTAEEPLGVKHLPLTEAVARNLFKLMAYKDEYEVARLHTDAAFHAKIESMFEGDFKLNYHLAPPLLASLNDKGELQKSQFGPWMYRAFKVLSLFKGLRGTALDVFGYTEERREERALIQDYLRDVEGLLATLNAENRGAAAEFARVPEQIRGYGHVKARNLHAARLQWKELLERYSQGAAAVDEAA